MKKIILLLLIGIIFISCKNESEKIAERNKYFLDSLKISNLAKERTEKILVDITKKRYLDTIGTGNSPVKVLNPKLFKKEYSNYRDIKFTYKNVSKKNIQGIRFEWYGENSFGEPADMGDYSNIGQGGGFTDDLLKAGKSSNAVFGISSKNAKKIITVRAYEVAFTDGSFWKLHKN